MRRDIPYEEVSGDLIRFISRCPSVYHVAAAIRAALLYAGFTALSEDEPWQLSRGGKYVVTRGDAALMAFTIPEKGRRFHITASHLDSPTFKIKENPEIRGNGYVRLNVEGYGGMNMASWTDRPLSVAGRVIVKNHAGRLESRRVAVDGTLLVIPSVAIHMERGINQGYQWNAQKDMLPLYGLGDSKTPFMDVIASAASVKKEDILGHDLFLYSRVPGTIWGAEKEFISAPRLDDLQCAFACFRGFAAAEKKETICMYALFDNEETGSMTARGAGSTLLSHTMLRIGEALGMSLNETMAAMTGSFLISADNAHALHPNHPELADPVNRPCLNGGIVIKYNARQTYATDGFTAAVFKDLCERAGAPVQTFTNRSDIPGGSTLGNISSAQAAIPTVDIGLPQLSMHSSWETAGNKDTGYLVNAAIEFYK